MLKTQVYTFCMYAARRPLAVVLALFFAIGIFMCVVSVSDANHSMEAMGTTACSDTVTVPGCEVAPNHLVSWQSSFAAILLELLSFLFLAALAQTLLRCIPWHLSRLDDGEFRNGLQRKYKSILPRHTLQQAFANGIVHSKVH